MTADSNSDAEPKAADAAPPPSNRVLIGRLLSVGWRYRRASLLVLGLHTLLVGISLAGLGLTGVGIDFLRHEVDSTAVTPRWPLGLAPPAGWSAMTTVFAIAGAVLGLALLNAAVRFLAAVAVADLTQSIVVQLRSDVYDKLQRLSFRFFDSNQSSSIINRATADVQAVRSFIDGVLIRVLTVALTLAVYLAYMLSVHVPLTIACLLTSPLLWLGAVLFSRMVQPAYLRGSELVDRMVLTLAENVQGISVVKGFAREPEEIEKFADANRRILDQKKSIFWKISTYQPTMGLLTQVNMLVLLGYGGYLAVQGELLLGAGMFVFANLLHEFANQVGQITNIANTIQTSLTGAQRVFEILDAPIEIESSPGAKRLPRARGGIRFERVSFSYSSGAKLQPAGESAFTLRDGNSGPVSLWKRVKGRTRNRPIREQSASSRLALTPALSQGERGEEMALALAGISFEARPGDCIGIVGETGAGKSTLLNLLLRFYDVTSGRILVDGTDVRDLRLDDLRRNVGIVFQESFLFSNTVAANIAFGHPDATREQITAAARIAAAEEFIRELPDGYDTVIGEHGSNLSGGQRQRLAIARALLLDPPILILDDATAAVDPETEHEIQAAIENAMEGRTTFLVSNRVSTLERADRILVLQKGQIIQAGTHAELVAQPGYYRRLAELQFAELADVATAAIPQARLGEVA